MPCLTCTGVLDARARRFRASIHLMTRIAADRVPCQLADSGYETQTPKIFRTCQPLVPRRVIQTNSPWPQRRPHRNS